MRCPIILIWLGLLAGGCTTQVQQPAGGPDVVFIVPGVGGPTGYDALIKAVERPNRAVQIVSWGAPPPFFFLNYSDQPIHDEAEQKFAAQIMQWRRDHPTGSIEIIGHSAGCGVAMGAIARLNSMRVDHLILLAPSVSPTYDLWPVLARMESPIHVYTSRQDSMLEWRTTTFGTYDRIKTAAAGVGGFTGQFPADKVIQHSYEPQWNVLGHDGGHWGPLADRFSQLVIAPLLAPDSPAPEPSLSARRTPASSPAADLRSSAHD